ncbi:hypothetical protein [Streptosporangium roseum]|uniref:hypothetical protein n=1 Tax=Streptosporangium roseum TaxID=2001 RepID=UPI00332606C1
MADRSVSINLRAKVSGFIAGMGQAKKSTEDLGRKMTETGAHAAEFRRRLEAATKALPKIEIDADSTPAEIEFAKLRSQMERLTEKRIGIDIDAGAARAELAQIERDLSKLQRGSANISVNADIGTALAELRAIDGEISKVDGRTAHVNVNADVAGALAGIAAVGAALAALPAALTIGVGVAGLGAAFAAAGAGAGAFAAVALPGLARVNEALKETARSAGGGGGGAGGAMKSAAQSAAEAAAKALRLAEAQDRVKDSAAAVRKAQQGVKDALRDVQDAQDNVRAAQERAGAAAERINEASAAGARRVADAERSLADAHRATQAAVEDLTRARERAIERIEDLELATKRGSLDEEGAQIAIERARQRLDKVMGDSKSSDLDKREADLAYREALARLEEVRERNGDLAKEKADSDKKGVEGSDEVTAAKERIIEAQRREAEAAAAVGDAQVQAAQDVAAAQRDAAEASRDVARARRDVGDAERKVTEAQQAVIKAQRDQLRATQRLRLEQLQAKAAMEQMGAAAGGGGGAASKMAELSKAEKALAKDIKAFSDAYLAWQRSLQPDVFPVISQGLGLMERTLPKLTPLVKGSSAAFSVLLKDAEAALAGPFWNTFLFNVNTQMPNAIIGLGRSFGNVTTGLAGVLDAFLPFTPTIVGGVEDATRAFSEWGQQLKDSPEFAEFIEFVKANAPQVWELIKNVAKALGNVAEAVLPLGVGSMAGLNLLAQLVAGMDPEHIQKIALAIIAIKLAHAGLSAVSAWKTLAENVGLVGGAAGTAKGKVAALGKAMLGLTAGVIGLEVIGSAVNGLEGQSKGVDKLTLALTELGQTGKWAGDLGDQWAGGFHSADEAAAEFRAGLKELQDPSLYEMVFDHPFTELGAVLPGIDSAVDRLEQRFSDMDTTLSGMVTSGNLAGANAAFERLKEEAGKAGVPVEKLQQLFPLYSQAVRVAGNASTEAASGIDQAKQKVDGLQQSLDTFASRTDALAALRAMEQAYKDAKAAIEASNGKLEINRRMTDEQRDAVVKAREQFGGYIQKVADGATAQEKLTGRTGDASIAVGEQLKKLFELAGKSSEAKEQVYKLAEQFGISRTQADKATGGAKDFRDMLAQLKSKQVRIELDTKKAREEFAALLKSFSLASPTIPVGIAAPAAPPKPKKKAHGGISNVAGREYMAAGGIRSVGANPSAMIAKSPYMISGRAGPDVIYGEAGWEAYIPLDPSKRNRGLQVLGEAASAMGMAVVPQDVNAAGAAAGASAAGSFTGGSLGGTMVTVTGITALQSSIDTTALGLTGSLGDASAGLDAAFGDAGAFTGIVDAFAGEVAGWGEVISTEVPPLTSAVEALGEAVSAAASAAGGDSKGDSGSKGDERNPRGKTAKGKSAGGGYSSSRLSGIDDMMAKKKKAKAAAEKKIGISGVATGSEGVAFSGGGGTNWSRVSRPVQSSSGGSSGGAGGGSGSAVSGGSSGGALSGGSLVHVATLAVTEKADVDQVAAALYSRLGSKGR